MREGPLPGRKILVCLVAGCATVYPCSGAAADVPPDAADEDRYVLTAACDARARSGLGLRAGGRSGAASACGGAPGLLLAQADLPPATQEAGVPARPDTDDARAASGPADFPWTLAPIRWGGNLSAEIRSQSIANQPRSLQSIYAADVRGGTYIWQPWFAQLTGGVGLLTSDSRNGTSQGSAGPLSYGADSTTVIGDGLLAVFPVSRFPFQARYERSDSRASGELTTSDYQATRVGLRQDYRPAQGGSNYSVNYDRSVLESSTFGRDTVDVLGARMNRQSASQNLDVTADRSSNTRARGGESLLNRVTGLHSYRDGAALSVESLASLNTNEFRDGVGAGFAENNSRFLQLNSFANWRPEAGSPWYITGGGRLFQSEFEGNATRSETQLLSGIFTANYQLDRNTILLGGAGLSRVTTDTASDLITTQNAGATYHSDAIKLGNFNYNLSLGGNAANESGGPFGSRQNVTAQFAHYVTRNSSLGPASTLSYNLGQGLSSAYDSVTGPSQALLNSAGASWTRAAGERATTYVSLTIADSRRTGYGEGDFQLANLQVSGQVQFDRNASATANLTVQSTRQSTPDAPATGFDTNATGGLSYQHTRAFGVPQLRYYAVYAADEMLYSSRRQGDVNAPLERVNQSLEQRLEYRIGRLEARLTARIAEIEGRRSDLVYFRVSRQFGAF